MPVVIGDLRLYTLDEIQDKLSISRRTLFTYIKTGRLRAQRFGSVTYVSEEALKEYFNPPKKTP